MDGEEHARRAHERIVLLQLEPRRLAELSRAQHADGEEERHCHRKPEAVSQQVEQLAHVLQRQVCGNRAGRSAGGLG